MRRRVSNRLRVLPQWWRESKWLALLAMASVSLVAIGAGAEGESGELAAPAAAFPQEDSGTLLLEGGAVVDMTRDSAAAVASVVVVNGRIRCIGADGECAVPDEARRLDARGRWIIPGLIDTHVHLPWESEPERAAREQLLRFALGTLAVRDAGAAPLEALDAALRGRERAASGTRREPRVVVAGLLVPENVPGGQASSAVEIVELLISRGVDAIKVKDVDWAADDVRESIDLARRSRMPVFGHTWMGPPPRGYVREAVDLGVTGISHMLGIGPESVADWAVVPDSPDPSVDEPAFWRWRRRVWLYTSVEAQEELARHMVRAGAYLEPTLFFERYFFEEYRPPDALNFLEEPAPLGSLLPHRWIAGKLTTAERERGLGDAYRRLADFVPTFKRAGGRVVAGSDAIWPGPDLYEEIRLLEDAGLTRLDALQAATRDAAIVLGLGDEIGTVEEGKIADLLILRADPLQDLDALLDIEWIVKGGVLHDPDEILEEFRQDRRDLAAELLRRRTRRFGPWVGIALVLLAAGMAFLVRRSRSYSRRDI